MLIPGTSLFLHDKLRDFVLRKERYPYQIDGGTIEKYSMPSEWVCRPTPTCTVFFVTHLSFIRFFETLPTPLPPVHEHVRVI